MSWINRKSLTLLDNLSRSTLNLVFEENGGGNGGGGGDGGGGDAGSGDGGGAPPSEMSDSMDTAKENGHDLTKPVRLLGPGYPYWLSSCRRCGGKMRCAKGKSKGLKGKCKK